jgi:hypothetical protein
MRLYYDDTDITAFIDIRTANVIDNAGGVADSMDIVFVDSQGKWSKWKPQKGDKIKITDGCLSSGAMYIRKLVQNRSTFSIKAVSTPINSKTRITKAWEKVRLLSMAAELTEKYGFELETYDIGNWLYERADQIDQTDFEYLAYRCMLEGYCLKITDGKAVIYNERTFEQKPSVKTIFDNEFDGEPEFRIISTGLFNKCVITCSSPKETIISAFSPTNAPAGPVLKPKVYVNNQAEADRFTSTLLRSTNKFETAGKVGMEIDKQIAAGVSVDISGAGMFDAKYFVDQIIYKLVDQKMSMKLHKPLEGY